MKQRVRRAIEFTPDLLATALRSDDRAPRERALRGTRSIVEDDRIIGAPHALDLPAYRVLLKQSSGSFRFWKFGHASVATISVELIRRAVSIGHARRAVVINGDGESVRSHAGQIRHQDDRLVDQRPRPDVTGNPNR